MLQRVTPGMCGAEGSSSLPPTAVPIETMSPGSRVIVCDMWESASATLIGPGNDTNGAPDIFRHDLLTGATIRVNVFNLLNANTFTGRTMQSGPNFGTITGVLLPRIGEVAVSYRF